MSTPMQRVLEALRATGADPKASGDGSWRARCRVAAHGKGRGDTTPSLSLTEGQDGHALVTCHAGCDFDSVVASLGLTSADFMPERTSTPRIVATYPYSDEHGQLLYEVVRYEPKGFRQRRPDGRDGWIWNVTGVRRVLFGLPEVIAARLAGQPIYVVEGEKDVLAARTLGVTATCNAGGAGRWLREYSEELRSATVIVIPDRDEPGRIHARQIAADLHGIADSVRLAQAAVGKDLSDHIAAGKTLEDLLPLADDDHAAAQDDHRPLTDTGNAERLHEHAGHDARYCHPWKKWLAWDGRCWRHDDEGRLMALSKRVARLITHEAETCADEDLSKKLSRWARRSESRGKRGAMVDLLACEPGIPIQPAHLDRNPMLLNCSNGTLDLNACILRSHERGDLITKLVPLDYDPAATCPTWEAFLERILPSAEVREFVQRAVGWSLTGDVSEQVLFFAHGSGANGKSTFLRVLLQLLGADYAIQAPPELLIEKPSRGHPTELADLFGVRVAVSVELGPGKKFDDALIKQLTGGDKLRARRMREDFWEFNPTHHIWIAANHKPVVTASDSAMWRRLMLIPFTVTIPERERDGQLLDKLFAELPGILAWAVRGCLKWRDGGLEPPAEVQAATRDYRADMDVIGDFLEAECVTAANASVHASALHREFSRWAADNGEEPITQQQFGQAMSERGHERRKRRGVKVYVGLALRSEGRGGPGGPLPPSIENSHTGSSRGSEAGSEFLNETHKSSPLVPPVPRATRNQRDNDQEDSR